MDSIDKIIKSIFALNPTAQFTFKDNNIDSIEWLEGTTPISKSDLEAKISTIENEIEQEKQDAITKKASAKQKLLDLGLTEEEIKLTFGI